VLVDGIGSADGREHALEEDGEHVPEDEHEPHESLVEVLEQEERVVLVKEFTLKLHTTRTAHDHT
jgi:hypothetical protein